MKKYTMKIMQDEYPENPREWDNRGTMACRHRRYKLGDEQMDGEELAEFIRDNGGVKQFIMLPLYLYDHSGITMNTTGFSCKWDSGMVGYIYISRKDIRKEWNVERISPKLENTVINYLRGEVETYDQYLRGEVFGFIINDEEGKEVDSCWGFYDYKYCKAEAEGVMAYLEKQNLEVKFNKIKACILNHVPLTIRERIFTEA